MGIRVLVGSIELRDLRNYHIVGKFGESYKIHFFGWIYPLTITSLNKGTLYKIQVTRHCWDIQS